MKIYSAQDYQSMSRKAANILSAHVILKPDSVLGLATGSTPIGMYKQLIEWYNKGDIDFSQVHTVNLDEYLGLAPDPEAECARYNQVIADLGGIDVQVLGMGHNGHIGFNEPEEAFELETHVVDLTDNTIDANARFFASRDEVPRQAITMGIKSIMQARHILVVVSGKDKAEIVKRAFFGPVTPKVPASILQMHPHVSLVADEAALSLL